MNLLSCEAAKATRKPTSSAKEEGRKRGIFCSKVFTKFCGVITLLKAQRKRRCNNNSHRVYNRSNKDNKIRSFPKIQNKISEIRKANRRRHSLIKVILEIEALT